MPSLRAASNNGCVSGPGIARSKNASTSACCLKYQRGKNVVSASSGYTTRSQPWRFASRISASMRATTCARVSLRAMGPSWAAPTVTMRAMAGRLRGELEHRVQQHVGPGREVGRLRVLGRVVADALDRRHEDHRGRADARQHLRVVAGAGGHWAARVAEALRGA